ncbi:MAG: right-handed parallel beta-helix repeat-containing protein [Prevotellaceae bacterium]|nr:right-handed parallel beta-helix repeat-containing protein [Candidatus Minthosoma caballi]
MKKLRQVVVLAALFVAVFASAQTKTITVKTADEFMKAIGPNRTIVIDSKNPIVITDALVEWIDAGKIMKGPAYYDSEDKDESRFDDGSYVTYTNNTDGVGLQVKACPNLTIRSKKGMATLLATPRYVNVMEFRGCDGLTLQNIIMGHTDGGYCDKGVLEIDNCTNVHINDCDFFGCGTEGFRFEDSNNVYVNRSNVHDCTYYTMHVVNCNVVRFNDCKFYNNKEYEQINILGGDVINFTSCVFDNLKGPLFDMTDYQYFNKCVFRNCQIEPIQDEHYPNGYAILRRCSTIYGDTPIPTLNTTKPKFKMGKWSDGLNTYSARYEDDYRVVFRQIDGEGEDAFAVMCISADDNDYETAPVFGVDNNMGLLGAKFVDMDGKSYLRILDDGGELIKSFFYIDKKQK